MNNFRRLHKCIRRYLFDWIDGSMYQIYGIHAIGLIICIAHTHTHTPNVWLWRSLHSVLCWFFAPVGSDITNTAFISIAIVEQITFQNFIWPTVYTERYAESLKFASVESFNTPRHKSVDSFRHRTQSIDSGKKVYVDQWRIKGSPNDGWEQKFVMGILFSIILRSQD